MTPEQIERLALRRVKAKMGWFYHAAIYVVVNLFLITGATLQGRLWYWFPLLGWGLGLAIHGAAVWLSSSVRAHQMRERMLEKERKALQSGSA